MSLSARRAWIEILASGINPDQSGSLSARRAWIEIGAAAPAPGAGEVALRKESVDRNNSCRAFLLTTLLSLSARRAWIEIR